MIVSKIQEESLRTYLFTYSSVYDTLSLVTLAEMFELDVYKVHSIISKMIINEELMVRIHRYLYMWPGRVAQSVGHLTRKSGVLGLIPGLATYFRFSFCFFKKGSCQLLAKVCARSTG